MSDEIFVELFDIEFEGNVGELNEKLQQLIGIESVSVSEPDYEDVDRTLSYEISYDAHETDRTRLAMDIESIDEVTNVTFA